MSYAGHSALGHCLPWAPRAAAYAGICRAVGPCVSEVVLADTPSYSNPATLAWRNIRPDAELVNALAIMRKGTACASLIRYFCQKGLESCT
jgi:hypothetical protein